jgi:hypothetical chaperone protein
MSRWVGLDFGTTNSSLAVVDGGGRPRLAQYPTSQGSTPSFRSLLYFTPVRRGRPQVAAGPEAIRLYLDSEAPGRLVQSLKSYLASRTLLSTSIFNTAFSLEELLACIFRSLRTDAERSLGPLGPAAVVGRPVRFVDSRDADSDGFALERLRKALQMAGFEQVRFEYEPVAAAHAYRRRLSSAELALIADFGGGTTDFSLVRLTPLGSAGRDGVSILGSAGVPIAGDCFDGRLVASVVAPALGEGTDFSSALGRELPVPAWIYVKLRRWHHVSFLKARRTLSMLHDITRSARVPESLKALRHLIEQDLGFSLHQAVQATKFALSDEQEADFDFEHGPIDIRRRVERAAFESYMEEDLAAIETALVGLLSDCEVKADAVDAVFMTGGSSFVPSVRAIFARLFGAEKLRAGEELTTVASGLALCAADLSS